ncbi:5570_t:CDS:2 [Cetraspora pellucida]|uniref:5570_t:CDS:1 n=1 Tax=Cetraspora pellucida TaxID=1433469 RepID=A0ACA9K3S6_9GLOM|nr:5570_t:CDS:2 [Cetraspora pellucida]
MIGSGGFATVYSADSKDIEKVVALKKLNHDLASDNESSLGGVKNEHDKNILVHDGRLKITDFGLAKSLENDSKSIEFGTYAYSDPKYLENSKFKLLHVTKNGRETPIDGSPAEFISLYRDAWNIDPDNRPTITKIRDRLNNIKIPVDQIDSDQNHKIDSSPNEYLPIGLLLLYLIILLYNSFYKFSL